MAEYMKKLVYLTEEQKNTLFANGSITVGGKTITYDPNDVYVTPRDIPDFRVGTVETLPAGSSATASITGTGDAPVINLGIPKGDQGVQGPQGDTGDTGLTPDLQIGTVSTLPAGSSAIAAITGTDEQPILNLGIPQGIKGDTGDQGETGLTPDLSVGTVSTLPAESSATVTITGTDEDPVLNFGIPQGVKGDKGDTGATPDLTIGTVSTLPAGSSATATITGTPEDPVLNLGIPKGDAGEVTQAEFDALADDVSDIQDTLEHKADIDGYYTDMTVGAAEQVVSSTMVEDNAPYKLRTSGGSTDIGNRAYVDKIVGGTVAWNQQVRDAASENVTEYADVVTVTDAVVDDAAVSVQLEPVQDLHGYDSPWPAGGGKNLCPPFVPATGTGLTVVSNQDGSLSVSGTATGSGYITEYAMLSRTIPSGTSFVVSIKNAVPVRIRPFFDSGVSDIYEGATSSGAISLNTDVTKVRLYLFLTEGTTYNFTIYFQLEVGSSATSWTPYANICPISGWDEVNVWDDPRHGGLVEWNQQLYFDSESWTLNGMQCSVNNGRFTMTGTATLSGTTALVPSRIYNKTKPVQGHVYVLILSGETNLNNFRFNIYGTPNQTINFNTIQSVIFTCNSANATDAEFVAQYNTGEEYSTDITSYLCDLTQMFGSGNEPSTVEEFRALFPNDYYAYNAGQSMTVGQVNGEAYRHYTITLPTSAGTVYGGELTVNKDGSGQLVVDRASVDLGTLNWTYVTNDGEPYFAAYVNDTVPAGYEKKPGINQICSCYKNASNTGTNAMHDMEIGATGSNTSRVFVKDSRYTDLPSYIAFATGQQLVYQLVTPLQFTLTATQVQTLLGTNHVWSDAGQLSLTYTGTDEYLTLTSGRKYMTRINGTDSMVLGAGQEVTAVKGTDNVFDLTQMLGTSVADYVYQQGASYFRKWFGASRYAYNAGELISVQGVQSRDVVGFNQWDEEWELGNFSPTTLVFSSGSTHIVSKNKNPIVKGETYYIKAPYTITSYGLFVVFYDASNNALSRTGYVNSFTAPEDAVSFRIAVPVSTYGNTYNHDICINLSHSGTRNGSYEPYTHRSYPLDSTLTLRGIPKVGTNGVYWDGDEYGYDGAVKRRYGVVDLGTLNWTYRSYVGHRRFETSGIIPKGDSALAPNMLCVLYSPVSFNAGGYNENNKSVSVYGPSHTLVVCDLDYSDAAAFKAAMQGVYLIYELNSSTTESATPYQHIQSVDDWGTEEFVSGTITPVGHLSKYPSNLRDKLQHLPALASSNGSYIITQTDGQMVLSPFPTPPTTAGNYLLKATVSGGNATYSWVAQ